MEEVTIHPKHLLIRIIKQGISYSEYILPVSLAIDIHLILFQIVPLSYE